MGCFAFCWFDMVCVEACWWVIVVGMEFCFFLNLEVLD